MEKVITLKYVEEFTLPQVTPDVRRRELRAQVGVEGKPTFPGLDLNRVSLDYALACLRGLEPGTTAYLIAPEYLRDVATQLAIEFRLALILLPEPVFPNAYSWAIATAHGVVYSLPAV